MDCSCHKRLPWLTGPIKKDPSLNHHKRSAQTSCHYKAGRPRENNRKKLYPALCQTHSPKLQTNWGIFFPSAVNSKGYLKTEFVFFFFFNAMLQGHNWWGKRKAHYIKMQLTIQPQRKGVWGDYPDLQAVLFVHFWFVVWVKVDFYKWQIIRQEGKIIAIIYSLVIPTKLATKSHPSQKLNLP